MTRVVSQAREVERGVWIREQWLREAGLAGQVQIIVRPREIRIQEAARETPAEQGQPSERGLQMLRSLGTDAEPGYLPNASTEHDRYLYAKSQ